MRCASGVRVITLTPNRRQSNLSLLPSKILRNFATVTMEVHVGFTDHRCVASTSATGSETPLFLIGCRRRSLRHSGSVAILAGDQVDESPSVELRVSPWLARHLSHDVRVASPPSEPRLGG